MAAKYKEEVKNVVKENPDLIKQIPLFWSDVPRTWFESIEAVTGKLHLSQHRLSEIVQTKLEKTDVDYISDILLNVPKDQQYKAIKERFIAGYEEAEDTQFEERVAYLELGDQKPSQLLQNMRSLAKDRIADSKLRTMWLKLLPAKVKSVIDVCELFNPIPTLEEQVLLADELIKQAHEETVSLLVPAQPSPSNTQINEIKNMSLKESKTIPSHTQPSTSDQSSTHCRYHEKFGNDAIRCVMPCSYKVEQSQQAHEQPVYQVQTPITENIQQISSTNSIAYLNDLLALNNYEV